MSDTPQSLPSTPSVSLMKRCKIIWRVLLISNFAVGAFLFANAKHRKSEETHGRTAAQKLQKIKAVVEAPPEPVTSSMDDLDYDNFFAPVTTPVEKVQTPMPEEQQREIFQWILEEKRKVKPTDRVEKKQINEEKAILKQFLRAKSIPKF